MMLRVTYRQSNGRIDGRHDDMFSVATVAEKDMICVIICCVIITQMQNVLVYSVRGIVHTASSTIRTNAKRASATAILVLYVRLL